MSTITPRAMRSLFTVGMLVSAIGAQAQIGINATGALPNSSAMLDLNSTTRGLLVPRMTGAQKGHFGRRRRRPYRLPNGGGLDHPRVLVLDTDLLPTGLGEREHQPTLAVRAAIPDTVTAPISSAPATTRGL
ncbi:MAG: hypothetical protein IPI07_07325 [Flavobacteriales bacterium]|nr:hypothetical protein [Flavobacteriales bacterium]